MKTKVILFLAISAITTLSFTFASIGTNKRPQVEGATKATSITPIGGVMAEDKI
jgi:hypothetical protein